jgi:ATP:ADP antiporter, AAA family
MSEQNQTNPIEPFIDRRKLTLIDRFCCLFTDTRPGEGIVGLLMAGNIMLILIAFYMIKPLREGWISIEDISGFTKMEVKAYSSYGQSMLLILVILFYNKLVASLPRFKVIERTIIFCISNLLLFWFLQPNIFFEQIPGFGIIFYLWSGMFGAFMVAQTWTFIIDLYNNERGSRLLPLIAIGGTSGAVVGSWIVEQLVNIPFFGSESLLLLVNLPLIGNWLLSKGVDNDPRFQRMGKGVAPGSENFVPTTGKTFKLVFGSRFLLMVATATLLLNWVNSNGENLLFRIINEYQTKEFIAMGISDPSLQVKMFQDGIIKFYGHFYFLVNIFALILQALVASRLLKYGGFTAIALALPILVLTSSIALTLLPILSVIKFLKIAENATDYSINNTARQVLWLPLSFDVKFKAKTTIDSLFARLGDGMAAVTVLFGVNFFLFSLQSYFILNAVLVLLWLSCTIYIVRTHRRLMVE